MLILTEDLKDRILRYAKNDLQIDNIEVIEACGEFFVQNKDGKQWLVCFDQNDEIEFLWEVTE